MVSDDGILGDKDVKELVWEIVRVVLGTISYNMIASRMYCIVPSSIVYTEYCRL